MVIGLAALECTDDGVDGTRWRMAARQFRPGVVFFGPLHARLHPGAPQPVRGRRGRSSSLSCVKGQLAAAAVETTTTRAASRGR